MAFEAREGQGALFPNDKKGNDRAPDFKGYILWKGERIQVAGWKKDTRDGSKFLSLKADSDPRHGDAATGERRRLRDDDIPF